MYIKICWNALNGTPPEEIEGEIFALLVNSGLKFTDCYTPWDGMFVASIQKGYSRYEVQLLHDELIKLCPNRFSYVITATPNNWDMCRSVDQTDAVYARIVAYKT